VSIAPLRTVPAAATQYIPRELLTRPQWCVYRTEPKADGGLAKVIVPARAPHGGKASNTRPADWTTFEAACGAMRRHADLVGLVFAMGPEDDLALVDVDKVRDPESGLLTDEGAALIAPFVGRAYLEVSPSGRGVHIIARAPGIDRAFAKATHSATAFAGPWEVQVSVGGQPQFLTITGHVPDAWALKRTAPFYDDPLVDAAAEVRALIASIEEDRARRAAADARVGETKATRAPAPPRVTSSTAPGTWTDDEVLRRIRSWPRVAPALEGDTSPWGGDHSRADSALAYALRRAGATEAQAVRLFEDSALYRAEKRPYRLRGSGEVRPYVENLIAVPFSDPNCPGWAAPEPTITLTMGSSTRREAAPAAGCCEHEARIADLEAAVAALEREVADLEADRARRVALISAAAAVRRNRALPESVRNVAIAAASVIARAGADVDEAAEEGDTSGPLFKVRLPVIADIAGTSTSTASKALKTLAATGALRLETRSEPVTYPNADGVLVDGRALRILIGPPTSTSPTAVVDMLAKAAQAAPETPRNHGGRRLPRPQCPEHPEAGLVITSVTSCAECGEHLEQRVSRVGVRAPEPTITLGGHSRKMKESPLDAAGGRVSPNTLEREDERIGTAPPPLEADVDEPREASVHLETIRNGGENIPYPDPFPHARAAYAPRPPADEGGPPTPQQPSLFAAAGGGV
jgi:hypothetical protein